MSAFSKCDLSFKIWDLPVDANVLFYAYWCQGKMLVSTILASWVNPERSPKLRPAVTASTYACDIGPQHFPQISVDASLSFGFEISQNIVKV